MIHSKHNQTPKIDSTEESLNDNFSTSEQKKTETNNRLILFLQRFWLLCVVFITGACVLITEIVATRVLSPYFGNSIFTVSGVISTVLAALSIGYYVGGKLADRYPSSRLFFQIILASGITIVLLHFLSLIFLPVLGYQLSIFSGPILVSLIFFFPSSFLLGTLSPFALKLSHEYFPEEGIGTASGKIFFWSTFGSIIGSLSAGFFLIPMFGTNEIIIANGLLLSFVGGFSLFILSPKKKIENYLFVFSLLFLLGFMAGNQENTALYSADGVYSKLTIFDKKQGGVTVRFFQQDRSNAGATIIGSEELAYSYTKYYALYQIQNPDIKNALIIGGGIYSVPKILLKEQPNAYIDVSEIEPSLLSLSKEYFYFQDENKIYNHTTDGRRFLHDTNRQYDFIFGDAYSSLFSIPSHLTTIEFFKLVRSKLSPDGLFVVNIIGSLAQEYPSFVLSEIKTFQEVFPNSYFFAVISPEITTPQNIIMAGYNGTKKLNLDSPFISKNKNPIIADLKKQRIDMNKIPLSGYPLLTDNYSPTEYFVSKILQQTADR